LCFVAKGIVAATGYPMTNAIVMAPSAPDAIVIPLLSVR
jgi:hypothetical protein